MKKTILTFMAISLISLPSSIAATQGTLENTTSNGSFDVSLTIPDRVRITGLQDINFGTHTNGDFNDDFPICVYSNTPTARYAVTATGSGASNAFQITNGADNVSYRVYWNDTAGTTTGETLLSAGVQVSNIGNANQVDDTCATGGDSANLHVEVLDAAMDNVSNGTYTGTLTILIEPS